MKDIFMSEDKLLIDTSVLLQDPNVLIRILRKKGIPVLSNTILQEIDFNKKGNGLINKNARYLFREFTKYPSKECQMFPCGRAIRPGDVLTRFDLEGGPVYVLARRKHETKINNDYKIIEMARDYDLKLLTRDNALCVQAKAAGVDSIPWTGPQDSAKQVQPHHKNNQIKPFQLYLNPIVDVPKQLVHIKIPSEGARVHNQTGQSLVLIRKISEGGEGVIYETDALGVVCKVYHPKCLTDLKRKKIELMISRRIHHPGVCWPLDIALNSDGDFVGFYMPKAEGKPVQTSMFVKPVLQKNYPDWMRIDLVSLCLSFLHHVEFLHSLNILIGDINPLNLLITRDSSKIWIVDTDSFQVENFPCPVGTINFTAPEIQGKNYSEFLRTKENEEFAIATMIFMMLLPGKPPYSQQGGGSPAENIKNMDFPYSFQGDGGRNAPQGPWFFIWNNLPFRIKEKFDKSFRGNQRIKITDWIDVLEDYRRMIQREHASNDIFPNKVKVRNGIPTVCTKCGQTEEASQMHLDKLEEKQMKFLCGSCNEARKTRIRAKEAEDANDRAMRGEAFIANEKVAVTCDKCGVADSTSKDRMSELINSGKNYLCRACVQKINASRISATCSKCSKTEVTSKEWIDKLAIRGQTFLCKCCVDEVRKKKASGSKTVYSNNAQSSSEPKNIFSALFGSFFN